MDIADEVQEVPGHESPLERDAIFIGLEDALAPVDDIDSVDVLLVLGHALEGKIWVVGSA